MPPSPKAVTRLLALAALHSDRYVGSDPYAIHTALRRYRLQRPPERAPAADSLKEATSPCSTQDYIEASRAQTRPRACAGTRIDDRSLDPHYATPRRARERRTASLAGDLLRARDLVKARLVAARVLLRVARQRRSRRRASTPSSRARISRRGPHGLAARSSTARSAPRRDRRADRRELKKGGKVDALVRAILRTCVYQLVHLDRTPGRAVVHGGGRPRQGEREDRVGAFVNAVAWHHARGASDARVQSWPVVPPFLVASFEAALGERASLLRPEASPSLDPRVVHDVDAIAALAARILAYAPRATCTRGKIATRCLKLHQRGRSRHLQATTRARSRSGRGHR